MSNDPNRNDSRDARNDATRPAPAASTPGEPGASQPTSPDPSSKQAAPANPLLDGSTAELPTGFGVQQQTRLEQPEGSGGESDAGREPSSRAPGAARRDSSGKGEGKRSAQPFAAGDVGDGPDGYGGAGSGTEQTRGAHPRGERADDDGDRHPGSGRIDANTVTPPDVAKPRQAPGRPKGQTTGQQPVSTKPGEGARQTTNRPGGNPDVQPRLGEKTKTYEGPTGVSGEAGSNADDV